MLLERFGIVCAIIEYRCHVLVAFRSAKVSSSFRGAKGDDLRIVECGDLSPLSFLSALCLEIPRKTKPNLPEYWKTKSTAIVTP
jgi:hypothetical protein